MSETTRKLASIRSICSVESIYGATRIELAKISGLDDPMIAGWQCVVGMGEFKPCDLCVYFEIDSIVPKEARFSFMLQYKYRVRTVKRMKIISQGLAMPVSLFPEIKNAKFGDDMTESLGIVKYDSQKIKEDRDTVDEKMIWWTRTSFHIYMIRYKWYRSLFSKRKGYIWPTEYIPKTDEERLQNMPFIVSNRQMIVDITEKLDGMSITALLYEQKKRHLFSMLKTIFLLCSRNVVFKKPGTKLNIYWKIEKKYHIQEFLEDHYRQIGEELAIQGEIIGPGIQKNKYKREEFELYVFTVKNLTSNTYLTYQECVSLFAGTLFVMVPRIYQGTLPFGTIEEAEKYCKGKSLLNSSTNREGIVCRNTYVVSGESPLSFKVVDKNFLLKEENDE